MAHADIERLRSIKTFPSLVKYLRDELDWPIESDDVEELTFEYEAEELGIDPKTAAKIQEIKQLRPMDTKQPWGIFFVKFEPKRLPVVVLRKILNQLVIKKRASSGKSNQAAWNLHDLLFISAYGEQDERQITFAHFTQDPAGKELPTLRVLGWDGRDTALHVDEVVHTLKNTFRWPRTFNPDEVRERWSSAFTYRHREVITTARDLAERLAVLASRIRDQVLEVMSYETEKGAIRQLFSAFRAALVHDLQPKDFADMYAQTIAYGLLSARIADPTKTTLDDFAAHMRTNPFLRELMETFLRIGGRKGKAGGPGIDFDELGVSEVVALLDEANMEAVVRDFGDRNPTEDPVIHFYEHFLAAYDKQLKVSRGVFYTPQPVVSYIVHSAHELLQTEFGLEDGLADTTTWGEMLRKHPGLKLPPLTDEPGEKRTISPNESFVQILDPATGTATFLVEVIDVIYRTLAAKWKQERLTEVQQRNAWNDYVPQHLLPRLHAFELMMAPYAIAHMKVGLKLTETGYRFGTEERARIYLTNALEPWVKQTPLVGFDALAHEAAAVNEIKRYKHFTVVIGNPPYSVSSWNTGAWITRLTEDYKRTVRNEESQIQSLSNDYIKFLRFGEWHIERTGTGVLGLITGHGYLSGTQPRDLRSYVSNSFDHCYCLDLHGSVRRVGTNDSEDEPVFEIMTGVAIFVGCRDISHKQGGITLLESLTGRLDRKFAFLREQTALNTSLGGEPHRPSAPNFYFAAPATAQDISDEYHLWPDFPAIFGTGNRQADKEVYWATGLASQQDELAMSFTKEELEMKMAALAGSSSFEDLRESYRVCTTNQWSYNEAKEFVKRGLWKQYVGQVAYRPFDRQWTVFHKHILTILRNQVMSQLGGKTQNIGLIVSRAVNDMSFAHCFVTNEPVDKIFISSKTSTNAYVFPLFFQDDDIFGKKQRPNLSQAFLTLLAKTLSVGKSKDHGLPIGITAEDIFHYAYAVIHSPGYRTRFAEFLKIDFPRLPLTGSLELFRALAKLGSELTTLHLLESTKLAKPITEFIGSRNPEIEKITWSTNTVWIDKAKTTGFKGVSDEVWNFHIGGYQVCEKWLKDRKGRPLSKDDLTHYQKIVLALSETIRLMCEIDKIIETHGGWPGAFSSKQ